MIITCDRVVEPPHGVEREPAIDPRFDSPRIRGQGAVVDRQSFVRLAACDQHLRGLRVCVEQVRLVGEGALEAAQSFLVLAAFLQHGAEQVMGGRMRRREFHCFAQQLLRFGELALLGHDQG